MAEGVNAKTVRDFHKNADTDGSAKAIHHTLGSGPSQASPGNHTHDGGASAPIEGFSASNHNHDASYAKTDVPWINITLLNGWLAYGSGHRTPQYRKVGDTVELRGLVKSGPAPPSHFCLLPAGYRPTEQEIFIVMSNTAFARVDANTSGNITLQAYGTGGSNAFVSLANIKYSTI